MEAEYLAGEHDPKSPATANLLRGNFQFSLILIFCIWYLEAFQ